MLKISDYDEVFLNMSWKWLNDPEIKALTATPDFTREDQMLFFNSLPSKKNYHIRGVTYNDKPIGVVGLKNISETDGEYFGYIGDKNLWGRGLGQKMQQYIIDIAGKSFNLQSVYLKVISTNTMAIKSYRNFGFKEDVGHGNDQFIIMKYYL